MICHIEHNEILKEIMEEKYYSIYNNQFNKI